MRSPKQTTQADGPQNNSKRVRIWYPLLLVGLFIVAPEIVLRMVGFRNEPAVSYGALRPDFKSYFAPDKDLFWTHSPETPGINSLGFRGREVVTPKPNNSKRILFIGDSCTDQDFAQIVEAKLNRKFAGDSVFYECVILAAPGYSSYQGKVLAHKYAEALDADLAFVCYGWNDHWLAYGAADKELAQSDTQHFFNQLYHTSRLLQLGRQLFFSKNPASDTSTVLTEVRVPLSDFESNMSEICQTFTQKDIPVVLITPPANYEKLASTDYLFKQRLAKDRASALANHRSYCEATRNIAREYDARLLDLESEFNQRERLEEVFLSDGIHYAEFGKQLVGLRVFEFINEFKFGIIQ